MGQPLADLIRSLEEQERLFGSYPLSAKPTGARPAGATAWRATPVADRSKPGILRIIGPVLTTLLLTRDHAGLYCDTTLTSEARLAIIRSGLQRTLYRRHDVVR